MRPTRHLFNIPNEEQGSASHRWESVQTDVKAVVWRENVRRSLQQGQRRGYMLAAERKQLLGELTKWMDRWPRGTRVMDRPSNPRVGGLMSVCRCSVKTEACVHGGASKVGG